MKTSDIINEDLPLPKKKDPAMSNLDYQRLEQDFYETPLWMTETIMPMLDDLNMVDQHTHFLEPACGEGAMSKVIKNIGFPCDSYDLIDRGYGKVKDFFDMTKDDIGYANFIFTNPPFGDLAEYFVRHALDLTENVKGGKVGMILRNEWDCAKGRMDLFQDHPAFTLKVVFTTRPRWIANSTGSPRHNYCALFWDWDNTEYPIIRYLNKNT